MFRNILAVIGGVGLGSFVFFIVQLSGTKKYPLPSDLNMNNPDKIAEAIQALPTMAFVFTIASIFLGSFFCAFIASKIAENKKFNTALVAGLVMLIASVGFVTAIPYPIWVMITCLSFSALGTVIGAKIGSKGEVVIDY